MLDMKSEIPSSFQDNDNNHYNHDQRKSKKKEIYELRFKVSRLSFVI
jgi:hypothetical protein